MSYHFPQRHKYKYPPNTKSGMKGVYYMKNLEKKPWKAYITHHGEVVTIGYFATKEEAAQAYNEYALRIYGPEAYLNPVPQTV